MKDLLWKFEEEEKKVEALKKKNAAHALISISLMYTFVIIVCVLVGNNVSYKIIS